YADADSIVLTAQRFTSDAGTDYPGLGTSVTIPRSQIAQLEERHVSKARTALVLGGGVAALVAIVASVGPLLGSSSGAPPPPPPRGRPAVLPAPGGRPPSAPRLRGRGCPGSRGGGGGGGGGGGVRDGRAHRGSSRIVSRARGRPRRAGTVGRPGHAARGRRAP